MTIHSDINYGVVASSSDSSGGAIMESILIFGAGGHAKVVADIAIATGLQIEALVVERERDGFFGIPVVSQSQLAELKSEKGVVAVGNNSLRKKIVDEILQFQPNFEFVSVVHPSATVAREVQIEHGSMILAGAVINSGAQIGAHCIVNTSASIDHDCVLGEFSSVAPGCTLGGTVSVGERTAVGLGAKVINNVRIGANSLVGAGSVVVRDVADGVVSYGVPSREIRKNK